MNRNGFTLVEMWLTLALLSVFAVLAAPHFNKILKRQEVDGQITELVSLFYFARSEAIKRNKVVSICKSHNHHNCGGTWTTGWLVFEDLDADGHKDINEEKLSAGKLMDGYELNLSAFGSTSYIRFLHTGLTDSHNGGFTVCPENSDRSLARAVIFTKTGRVRTSKDSNANGIEENASDNDLEC